MKNLFKKAFLPKKFNFFKFVPKFRFSSTEQGVELNLNQYQAQLFNEHDNLLNQIESGVIKSSNLPKAFNDLSNIMLSMTEYTVYLKGWITFSNFVQENLKSYTNDELLDQLDKFIMIGYADASFWNNVVEHLSEKTLTKSELRKVIRIFSYIPPVNSETLWSKIGKIIVDNMAEIDARDKYVSALSHIYLKCQNDEIYSLIERIMAEQNQRVGELKGNELLAFIESAVIVKELKGNDEYLISVKNKILDEAEIIDNHQLVLFAQLLAKGNVLSLKEALKLYLVVISASASLNQASKLFLFKGLLLQNYHNNNELIPGLTKNQHIIGSFRLPNEKVVDEFASLQKQLYESNANSVERDEKEHNFFINVAESIGMNRQFVRSFSMYNEEHAKMLLSAFKDGENENKH